jgi:transcriptional regulator with XRE-family HTH domain
VPYSENRRPPLGLYPEIRREALSKRIRLAPETVIRILRGKQKPGRGAISRIARGLKISEAQLISDLNTLSAPEN